MIILSTYIWSDRVRLVLQIKFYSNAMVGHFDEELNLLIWLNLSKSFYSKLENFSASVDVEIKLLASSYKFMSNPFTITWQLKIQIFVEIPKMVQSFILENLSASCDKSLVRKKHQQIDWKIKKTRKLFSLLGSTIKYAGQQQWLFS